MGTSAKGITNGWLERPRPGEDTTRAHAVNWACGVAIIGFVGYVFLWLCVKVLWAHLPYWSLSGSLPFGLLAGLGFGAYKLLDFTREHRDLMYTIKQETERENIHGLGQLPKKRIFETTGGPLEATLVRGVDGQMHRINTRLSKMDLFAVKSSLLTSHSFGVRAINSLLGDENRASGLRIELHKLGILEKPEARKVTRLTPEGIRAVRRWN